MKKELFSARTKLSYNKIFQKSFSYENEENKNIYE